MRKTFGNHNIVTNLLGLPGHLYVPLFKNVGGILSLCQVPQDGQDFDKLGRKILKFATTMFDPTAHKIAYGFMLYIYVDYKMFRIQV